MAESSELPWSAVLMAGGRSTRMGRDKAGLVIHGQPLWRHQLETLEKAGATEILIAGAGAVQFQEAGLPVLDDHPSGIGPLGGVRAGLARSAHDRVLFLAVDLPLMPPAFLRKLAARPPAERGAVPQRGESLEPLAALYPRAALALATDQAAAGHFSLQHFAREAATAGLVRLIPVSEEEEVFFRNCNTPDDWTELFGKKY